MRRTSCRARGFTLLESLVVLVLVVLAILAGLTIAQERLHAARIRVAAQQLAVHLRSARFTAVSTRSPVDVIVSAAPANTYQFTDVRGKNLSIQMPEGVRIVSSTSPISFLPNGSVAAPTETVLEVNLGFSGLERWTIDTELLGVPRLSYEREL